MQNLRYQGLIKLFRWGINLALGVELITLLVMATLMIVTINSDEQLISGWSAFTSEQPIEQKINYDEHLEIVTAVTNEINIVFAANNFQYYFLKFFEAIVTLLIIILITALLKRIFFSLNKENPFSSSNLKRLKAIAFAVMAFTPFSIIQSLVYRNYISNHITIEGKNFVTSLNFRDLKPNEIWLDFNADVQYLFIGAILLILSEVFRNGLYFKTDSESII
uniref:DUF2975 domain-containing protein n=1 Tax=Flavobacterium sp. TaxID=239 RepID=UPI00404B3962